MPILIFKSNIDSHAKLEKLEAVLCREQDVHSWTVDLEDCDKVLRIITKKAIKNKLLTLLKNSGFEISDL